MVISFTNQTAWKQLRDEGFVVSYRPDERERTPRDGVQETWCNRGRGTEKEFDVRVRHVGYMEPEENLFREFHPMSGFSHSKYWLQAVMRLHGEVPPTGHYYLVTRVDGE